MTSQYSTSTDWKTLANRLRADYPSLTFIEASQFSWHAGKAHISYNKEHLETDHGVWALMHEIGHALLGHSTYNSDVELLRIEVAAWEKAKEIAKTYDTVISDDYIEDALDSYRDWLHIRSTCPSCHERCTQTDAHQYSCPNCGASWQITRARLCRPYRKTTKKSSE